jgi:3-isopropylmalate dehydrogenase
VIVRELTGGIYFGRPQGRSEDGKTAYDHASTAGTKWKIVKLACEMASKRRGKVTVVDKANVLATSRLWGETALEISAGFKSVTMDFMFVDIGNADHS